MPHGQDADSHLLKRGGAEEQLQQFALRFTKISGSFRVVKQKCISRCAHFNQCVCINGQLKIRHCGSCIFLKQENSLETEMYLMRGKQTLKNLSD